MQEGLDLPPRASGLYLVCKSEHRLCICAMSYILKVLGYKTRTHEAHHLRCLYPHLSVTPTQAWLRP